MSNDMSSIQDKFFKCVIATNICTARLILSGHKKDVTNERVKGTFLSFASKEIFGHLPKHDYARFAKEIKIYLYKNSLMLAKIEFTDNSDSSMYTDTLYIDSLAVEMEYCDYKLGFNFKDIEVMTVAYQISSRNTEEVLSKIHDRLSYHQPVNDDDEEKIVDVNTKSKRNRAGFPSNTTPTVVEPKPEPQDWANLESITL